MSFCNIVLQQVLISCSFPFISQVWSFLCHQLLLNFFHHQVSKPSSNCNFSTALQSLSCLHSPDFHSCYQSALYVSQVKEWPPSTWGSHMAMGKEIRIAARKNTTGYKARSWRHCCKINMFEQFQQVKRCLSLLLLHLNLKHYRMLFARKDIGKLPSSPPKELNTQTRIIRISKFCNQHPEPSRLLEHSFHETGPSSVAGWGYA